MTMPMLPLLQTLIGFIEGLLHAADGEAEDGSDGEEEGSGKVAPGRFIPRFIKWIKWQKEVRQEAYTCLFPWLGFTLPPPPSFVPFSLSSGPSPAKGRAPVTAATR